MKEAAGLDAAPPSEPLPVQPPPPPSPPPSYASSRPPKRSSQPQMSDLRDQWRYHSFSGLANMPVSRDAMDPSALAASAARKQQAARQQQERQKKPPTPKPPCKMKEKSLNSKPAGPGKAKKTAAAAKKKSNNNGDMDDDVSSVSSLSSDSSSSEDSSSSSPIAVVPSPSKQLPQQPVRDTAHRLKDKNKPTQEGNNANKASAALTEKKPPSYDGDGEISSLSRMSSEAGSNSAAVAAAAAVARSQFIRAEPPPRAPCTSSGGTGANRRHQTPPAKKFCVRDGCSNLSIEDPQWDGEYCSTECCLLHVGDVRQLFAAMSPSDQVA